MTNPKQVSAPEGRGSRSREAAQKIQDYYEDARYAEADAINLFDSIIYSHVEEPLEKKYKEAMLGLEELTNYNLRIAAPDADAEWLEELALCLARYDNVYDGEACAARLRAIAQRLPGPALSEDEKAALKYAIEVLPVGKYGLALTGLLKRRERR